MQAVVNSSPTKTHGRFLEIYFLYKYQTKYGYKVCQNSVFLSFVLRSVRHRTTCDYIFLHKLKNIKLNLMLNKGQSVKTLLLSVENVHV